MIAQQTSAAQQLRIVERTLAKSKKPRQAQETRCRCMTDSYGGIKRCRAQAADQRGWCARHAHYNGANHTPRPLR